ncbi:MAG: PVC-type heme-binding CxxCH protein [Planctomycetota bacterium]
MPNSTRVSLFASLTLAAAGCTSSMSPGADASTLEPRASAEGSVQRAAADRPAGGGAKHALAPRSGDDVAFERVELARDFTCEGANFADFDRDGDQDVVAGPWWYEGPDWKTRHALYAPKSFDPAGYSDAFFAWPCDVDHDGWTDVVTVGFPGKEAFWYRNALAAKDARDVPWERVLIAPEVDNESPAFTDLDGDGAPELVFHTGGRFGFAQPVKGDPRAPWTFRPLSAQLDIGRFTHGLGVGDVNGDGRADVLWKEGWFEQPASLANDPEWTFHAFRFSDREGGAQMFAYDVDGDGDRDVITSLAAHHFGLSWFENVVKDGAITFVEHRVMDDPSAKNARGVCFGELHALALADVNGDGLLDVVTGKRWWSHGAQGDPQPGSRPEVWWFELVRGPTVTEYAPRLVDLASGVGTQLVTGDLDGDGRLDVVVGNKRGTFVLLQRTPEELRASGVIQSEAAVEDPVPALGAGADPGGEPPTGHDNLDFEKGDLSGWTATGRAFDDQPIRGDTVSARGREASLHRGAWWLGGYEKHGDAPTGTLTSKPFRCDRPWMSFLVGGGGARSTRVEVVLAGEDRVLFTTSGANYESMQRVVVDLRAVVGKDVFLRLVDDATGGWGHLNFDDVRFHAEKPDFARPKGVPAILPLDAVAHAGLAPKDAVKAMTTRDGFHAELVLAEPDVHQPVAFTFDAKGRLWLAEAFTYPKRADGDWHAGADDVVVFEDRDGDGAYETRTVFLDHLNLVSGLEVGFGGVWIGAAPYLLFVPDADGDLVPDAAPEVVLDGFGYQDTHETLNAFTWGPDGWLYGCHGVFTHSRVGKPGTPDAERVPIDAGVWRFHPTRRQFEVFAWGTSNPWGVDFDESGEAFVTACVIPHLWHVIPGARYERQAGEHFDRFLPGEIGTIADHRHYVGDTPHGGNLRSNSAGGGHAHCGLCLWQGAAFPEELRGALFFGNIHGNRLNMDVLERKGSGYVGHHGADFLLANDAWFRAIAMKEGPDGALWVIDWYDQQACHDTKRELWDRTNGRVYRVVHGERAKARTDLASLTTHELVELQTNRDGWTTRQARKLLQERGPDPTAQRELRDLLARSKGDEPKELRALWALHAVGGVTETLARVLLTSGSEGVRAWSARLALEDRGADRATLTQLERMAAKEPSPRVRLAIAAAVQRLAPELRWGILEALLARGEDDADANLPLMEGFALEPLVALDPDRALALAANAKLERVARFVVRRAAGEAKLHAALVRALARESEPVRRARMLEDALAGLADQRGLAEPAGWNALAERWTSDGDARVAELVQKVSLAFGSTAAFPELRRRLADAKEKPERRREALDALVRGKDAEVAPILRALLDDAALRGPALRALASFADAEAPAAVLARYASFSVDEKRDALNALAARASSARALLDAVADGRVPRADLGAFVVRALQNLGDAALSARLKDVWGEVRTTSDAKAKRIAELTAALGKDALAKADLPRGREVFSRTCEQCHTLFGTGGKVGPDLTGSNRADLAYLLSNVVDPNAVVPKDYLATNVFLKDERVVSGLLQKQTDTSITLATENDVVVIARADVDELKLTTLSTMPEGLLDALPMDDVRDLVAYLATPTQTSLRATKANVKRFFDGKTLAGWKGADCWSVEGGEIVGRTKGLEKNEFLVNELDLGDFRLELDVRLVNDAGNSGVQFRTHALEHGEVAGYQADVGPGWWGKLYEENGRGVLVDAQVEAKVAKDGWNHYAIEARGHRVRTWLNGAPCADLDDAQGAVRGFVALQLHSGGATEVRFRNLVLTLDP